MPRLTSSATLLLVGAVVTAAWFSPPFGPPLARADMVQTLRPGQAFNGDVPAGEPLRLTVEAAEGAKLRLQFTLFMTGADQYLPANFQRVAVTGPDGKPAVFDRIYADARYDSRKRKSTFFIRDWPVPKGGSYTFVITHLTRTQTRCTGKVAAIRPRRTKITGDADLASFSLPVAPDDRVRVAVRKVNGSAPFVAGTSFDGGGEVTPPQKRTKKGSTTRAAYYGQFGAATFRVGSQVADTPVGTFKGTILLKPYTRYGRAFLAYENPPDSPLVVHDPDLQVLDTSWAPNGVGIGTDGTYILVTGESGGQILGRYYDTDLSDVNPGGASRVLATSADLPPGETLHGHRLASSRGAFFVAFTSASGNNAALGRYGNNLLRQAFTPVVDNSADPTTDLFLATDGLTVSVGIPHPPNGHTVYQYTEDASDTVGALASVGAPVVIGGPSWPQSAGSAAVYRADQGIFEFWSPDSVAPGVQSDLHHVLYSPQWGTLTQDSKPIATAGLIETMCSSVVFDESSGVTILHWIEPNTDASGLGTLRRALFDAVGNEVPRSRVSLGKVRRNRPAALILENYLYVAAEGEFAPVITRHKLTR